MSDPMENMNNAADALNQVAERAGGFWDDADQRIGAKEAQVDGFLAGAVNGIALPVRLAFDPTVFHSKASLLADGVAVDPAANWQTEWRQLNGFTLPANAFVYPSGRRAFAVFSRSWANRNAGSGGNPPFSSDYSYTRCELVLANHSLTSVEINQWLLDNPDAPSPVVPAHIGKTSFSSEIPLIQIAGKHHYTSAFCRVRNDISNTAINAGQATKNSPRQEITAFGGNAHFGLHAIDCRGL